MRSEALFQLHNVVQEILGVGQALDVTGVGPLDLSFLILDDKIFAQCLQILLEDREEELVKKATSEIVLYLLQSEKVFGPKMWKIMEKKVTRRINDKLNQEKRKPDGRING